MTIFARFDSFVYTANKIHKLINKKYERHNICIVNLSIKRTQNKILELREQDAFVLTCFSGVIFGDHATILSRTNANMILFNCKHDMNEYIKLGKELGFDTGNSYCFGYPQLIDIKPKTIDNNSPVVFFEQIKFPATEKERIYLLSKLIEIANNFPSRLVKIKPRCTIGERNIHKQNYHLETVRKKHKLDFPSNLNFTYDDTNDLLNDCGMCITISSTVALEAIARNISTAIITDFGISKLNYTSYFVGSGCLISFDSLIKSKGIISSADEAWIDQYIKIPDVDDFHRVLSENLSLSNNSKLYTFPRPDFGSKNKILRRSKKLFEDPYMFCMDSKYQPLKKFGSFFLKDRYKN